MKKAFLVIVLLSVINPLKPQGYKVIPPESLNNMSPSNLVPFNLMGTAKYQLLISSKYLQGLENYKLKGIELRNSNHKRFRITKGKFRLKVYISQTTVSPKNANKRFALNAGKDKLLVYNNVYSFTDLPRAGGTGTTPWGHKNNIKIQFSSYYLYKGGNLCVELVFSGITGEPLPMWVWDCRNVKYNWAPTYSGFKTPKTQKGYKPVLVHNYAPGSNFGITVSGIPASTLTFLIIGVSNQSWNGIPLPIIINNQYALNTSLDFMLATISKGIVKGAQYNKKKDVWDFINVPSKFSFWGNSSISLSLPKDPSFIGTRIFTQWITYRTLDNSNHVNLNFGSTKALKLESPTSYHQLDLATLKGSSTTGEPTIAEDISSFLMPVFRIYGDK